MSGPTKYRKKPVVIEALQFTDNESAQAIAEWLGKPPVHLRINPATAICEYLRIDTLEGHMTANIGDWIIKGVRGEFYPCKPDIFAATYEAVDS